MLSRDQPLINMDLRNFHFPNHITALLKMQRNVVNSISDNDQAFQSEKISRSCCETRFYPKYLGHLLFHILFTADFS